MTNYFELTMFDLAFYLSQVLVVLVLVGIVIGILSLPIFFLILYAAEKPLALIADRGPSFIKYILLMFRALKRNLMRTSLTYLATFVLVFVATAILSVLDFIDQATSEKEGNLKGIITEKFHNPSGMPHKMPDEIWEVAKSLPEPYQPKSYRIAQFFKANKIEQPEQLLTLAPPELRPKDIHEAREMMQVQEKDDIMKWSFIAGSLDPDKQTFENMIFMFAMEPRKLKTMMPGIEELTGDQMKLLEQGIAKMESNRQGIVVGKARLKSLQKQVGDKISVYSKNFKDITFECEIIGELPEGRWDQAAAINADYLVNKLREYEAQHKGVAHESAPMEVALIWIRLPNKDAFQKMAEIVNDPKTFNISVKMETESGAYGAFLDIYRDLLWAARWLLVPAILATMCLVIANAISISVRERRTEMAVLKVLGFSPNMVMTFILGEALLVGLMSSMLSVSFAYFGIKAAGGIPLVIAFFPKFFVPAKAFAWGLYIGGATAVLGSIMPALSARKVKASDVFSKVA